MTAVGSESVVDIVGLTKRFGAQTALDRVSFSVRPGEIVALLGDNGAGKSTLIKCICGIHKPDDGHVSIAGATREDVSLTKAQELGVGVVFQDLALFDNLSVADNFFAGMEIGRPGGLMRPLRFLRKKEMLKRTRELLERLEVRIFNLQTPVGLLSGGQRQAIAVARGVAFARKLVILDEPTAALGLRERTNVLRILRRLPAEGISVLWISHNLEDVISVADRAVILRQGKFVGEMPATPENHERMVSLIVGGPTGQSALQNGTNNGGE